MRSKPTRSARSLRTQHIVAAIVPAAILLLCITGFVWAQKQVSIVVDGRTMHLDSQATDVGGLLSGAGVSVGSGDLVFPSLDSKVTAGMSVVVRHAIPVTVVLGSSENAIDVVGRTVADALVAAGVDPAAVTGVTPDLDEPLVRGMRITVPDCFVRISAVSTDVPYAVEQVPDGTLPKGQERVIRQGVGGSAILVYRSLVVGGVEGPASLSTRRVVHRAIAELVSVGSGDGSTRRQMEVAHIPARLLRGDEVPDGHRLHVVATAYSAEEPGASSGTATGPRCERGVIAVDPSVIPLGSHVYVPGYGYAIAADTGGMINGDHIDLCFNTVGQVNAWGKRYVTVIVLD